MFKKLLQKIAVGIVLTLSGVLAVVVVLSNSYSISQITLVPGNIYWGITVSTTLFFSVLLLAGLTPFSKKHYTGKISTRQYRLVSPVFSVGIVLFSFILGQLVYVCVNGVNYYGATPGVHTQTYAITKHTVSKMRSHKRGYNVYITYRGFPVSFEVPTDYETTLKHADSVTVSTQTGCLGWAFVKNYAFTPTQ